MKKAISVFVVVLFIAMAMSCQKNEVNQGAVPVEEQIESVPFFYVEKGECISKNIHRDKPLEDDGIEVLFSTEKIGLKGGDVTSTGSGALVDLYASIRKGNNAGPTMTIDGKTMYKMDVDLNEGAGGKYIYLYYRKSSTESRRITSIRGFSSRSGAENWDINYSKSHVVRKHSGAYADLNQGAGGNYIYLGYHYLDYTSRYVEDIKIITSNVKLNQATRRDLFPGWEITPDDLNKGAGGKYIYFFYKRNY